MKVDPTHDTVGVFFGQNPMYAVPKYQRGYAWEKSEIEDFINDITKCFKKRQSSEPINHFFGGIVSVEHTIAGVAGQKLYELVDGQQRMATFVLLMVATIKIYEELEEEASKAGNNETVSFIKEQVSTLEKRFVEFNQKKKGAFHKVDVLVLSKADRQFFKDLIRGHNPSPSRDSHRRLKFAYATIVQAVANLVDAADIKGKLEQLEIFDALISEDLSLLHIVTYNELEAYTLFRVLNDRGKSLTDGELLRARVLEILEKYPSQQDSVESLWDQILADDPATTEKFLKWLYISKQGKRADTNNFVDDFMHVFYGASAPITSAASANGLVRSTQEINRNVVFCRKLDAGEWPFPSKSPIVDWDENRLNLLVNVLHVTVVIPLLLSAIELEYKKFSDVVQVLERFMFRFKTIGNKEIGPLNSIIYSHSKSIRNNPAAYSVASLESQLHALQVTAVSDDTFKTLLNDLEYKPGGTNQVLKYFLITLEHYRRWYTDGKHGGPICKDKTRNYDFTGSTIEHIYPRNAPPAGKDLNLEPLKNRLGNLTFMGQADNGKGGNGNFASKKQIFAASSVTMNKEIAQKAQWSAAEVMARANELNDMACAVFNI
ncbi:DUF262 domain-containing HNH endonuclease family protein [Hymenobacter sp. BT770]|uniref:DUF262 domain-containing protein n=1 Tax=Hymenobacter sp. BT770 TaxID=2886942 RepID=UPI001D108A69|nr:DUF262 domain-containing protein [Hymenobacter sp. BT770]MCC3154615.1 DUF262 domain-containing HNH endonuclease family protein [Hymenobacter sp. BT770]MDO3416669.1 DUF262 domain-containing HNH endonuclease family protein [Hymenobacter sp. BT770]